MFSQNCNCSTILYSIVNNHIECLKKFSILELNEEVYLTSSSQHKFLDIIEYLLLNNCPYNEKFIRHIKNISLDDSQKLLYPLLNNLI